MTQPPDLIERVAKAEEPTRIKLGYWRNRWRASRDCLDVDALQIRPAGIHLASRRYPTCEIAEHEALKLIASVGADNTAEYLGPEFFPKGEA